MYIIQTDEKKGKTYIIEGEERPGDMFAIKRFICQVQPQETEEETRLVAQLILNALNAQK